MNEERSSTGIQKAHGGCEPGQVEVEKLEGQWRLCQSLEITVLDRWTEALVDIDSLAFWS